MLTTAEVAFIVAGAALAGTAATVIQKRWADRRDAWWQRVQWALGQICADQDNDDTKRTLGLLMLENLKDSALATQDDLIMIEGVSELLLPKRPDGETKAAGPRHHAVSRRGTLRRWWRGAFSRGKMPAEPGDISPDDGEKP